MKKILFLALFAFMLTGCYSINDPCSYSNSVWLLKVANLTHVVLADSSHVIDESCIEMYHVDRMPGDTPYHHFIILNDAGSERFSYYLTETLLGEEFSIIFRGKELYKGIFVSAPLVTYSGYTIDLARLPGRLELKAGTDNNSLIDPKDEAELFAYFDSVGKLLITD